MTYFGFDHHKKWTQAVATDEQGHRLREGRVVNTQKAFELFLKDLTQPWKGVVEAGPSWGWIYDTLSNLGVKMIVAHPLKVRAIAEAKIKTDTVDARMLAHLLRADLIPAIYVPTPEIRSQRMVWRERSWLVRLNGRLKNRIHWLLAHYHVETPEFSDLFGSAGRRFLSTLQLPDPGRRILQTELALLENYRTRIQEVYTWAQQETAHHPYRSCLESLPGFGPIFSSIVALEIDTLERFRSPEKLASYCGLVPSLYSSGEMSRLGGIGSQGNHWLKWAFVEGAWAAIKCSAYFRLHYQRLRRHKKPQVAIVACARRMCEIAFQLMRDHRFYEERPVVRV